MFSFFIIIVNHRNGKKWNENSVTRFPIPKKQWRKLRLKVMEEKLSQSDKGKELQGFLNFLWFESCFPWFCDWVKSPRNKSNIKRSYIGSYLLSYTWVREQTPADIMLHSADHMDHLGYMNHRNRKLKSRYLKSAIIHAHHRLKVACLCIWNSARYKKPVIFSLYMAYVESCNVPPCSICTVQFLQENYVYVNFTWHEPFLM